MENFPQNYTQDKVAERDRTEPPEGEAGSHHGKLDGTGRRSGLPLAQGIPEERQGNGDATEVPSRTEYGEGGRRDQESARGIELRDERKQLGRGMQDGRAEPGYAHPGIQARGQGPEGFDL